MNQILLGLLLIFNAVSMAVSVYFVGMIAHRTGYAMGRMRIIAACQRLNEAIENGAPLETIKTEWYMVLDKTSVENDPMPDYWSGLFKYIKDDFK